MRKYIPNPKTEGSGIICCIPQAGACPIGCEDCFFQSGRSYLEPLEDNVPNMPTLKEVGDQIVRVNDGNDSNNRPESVMASVQARKYRQWFYNTSIARNLEKFDAPVVLTVNPSNWTDSNATLLDPIPSNLMFVRVRVNTWNLDLVDKVVAYYSAREVTIILTFMRYYNAGIPEEHKISYVFHKHITNSYWVITSDAWDMVMARYRGNKWVYACGKDANTFVCRHCGNCLREYFFTMQKLKALPGK